MGGVDEKIYKMLETTKKSLSISEIAKEIKDVSKQEITKKLAEMNRLGIIYREVKEGKAYYSINPEDGEGRNASQLYISNINKVFTNLDNKQTIDDLETLNNINSNILEDVELLNKGNNNYIDFDINNLKYNKKMSFENKMYKMEIPDSFEYLQEKDRDFVAYLPKKGELKELPYDNGGSNIIIYPSTFIPFLDNKKRISETKRILYDIVFWNGGYLMFENYGGKPEYKVVELKSGRTGVIYMEFNSYHNFYFVSPVKEGFKQMRIVIEGINGTKEALEKIAISLMNKFEIKGELNDFKELNDKKYLTNKIDEKIINDWIINAEGVRISINEYFQIFAKLLSLKETVMKSRNLFNIVIFKKEIKKELDKYASILEKYIINGKEFINYLKKSNIEEKLKIPAYYCFKQFLNLKEFNINLEDGSTITKKIELVDKVKEELYDDEILKLVSDYQDVDYNSDSSIEQVNEELNKYCEEYLKQSKEKLKRLREGWESTKDEYVEGINNKVIQSEYELIWELNNIKQSARSYGHQYNDFLTELDIDGKKLLKQGANYLFIDSMNDIIEDVFDAFSDLHLSFSTSETAYEDLGTFDYEVSNELEDIKRWWKKEYDNNPEVVKKKEQTRKKQEEKSQKRKEKNEKFLLDISKNIEEEQQTFARETKEIQEELEFEKKKNKAKYDLIRNEQLDKLNKDKDNIITDLKKNAELLKNENDIKKEELSKLNFFKFIQKDRLKTEIDINSQNIEKYNKQITNVETDYIKEKNEIIKNIDNECNKKMKDLEKIFKMPLNPQNIIEKISNILSKPLQNKDICESKVQKENDKIKQMIYETLINLDIPVTIPDLMKANRGLLKYSNQKISALLKQMIDSKLVVKVDYNKKSYFAIGNENNTLTNGNSEYEIKNYKHKKELIDKNRNNSYSQTRAEIYDLLKNTKTINPIKKDEIAKIKNLSILRIYQILFSLEEDELISKSIRNGTIIFNIK